MDSDRPNLKLYFNAKLFVLGIAEPEWSHIGACRMVPFVRLRPQFAEPLTFLSHGDGDELFGFAEVPVAYERNDDWEEIGTL